MTEAFKKFINRIEEDYHSDFTEEDIKNITGYSYQHFSRGFKEIWNMTPQVYRKRRQLTLIALEIKRNSSSIKGSDLSPWADDSTFSKSFKREFNMTPSKYIKEGYLDLQEKLEIPPEIYMDYISKNNNKPLEERYEYWFSKYIMKYIMSYKYMYKNKREYRIIWEKTKKNYYYSTYLKRLASKK